MGYNSPTATHHNWRLLTDFIVLSCSTIFWLVSVMLVVLSDSYRMSRI